MVYSSVPNQIDQDQFYKLELYNFVDQSSKQLQVMEDDNGVARYFECF